MSGVPIVVHCRRAPYDVYIGRANARYGLPQSPWANPFTIGRDGDRARVIARYRDWLLEQPDLVARLPELRGKVLGSWCAPEACHGNVLAMYANLERVRLPFAEQVAQQEAEGYTILRCEVRRPGPVELDLIGAELHAWRAARDARTNA